MNTTFTKPKRLTNKNSFLLLFPPSRILRRASFILLLFFLSSAFSCKEDPPVIPPPPPPPVLKDTLTVAVTDVTHRSVSLNVQCTMNNVQSLVRLYRLLNTNETLVAEFSVTVQDTTIIDDNNGNGLQLNSHYFYYAVRIDTVGERKDTSNIVEAATLDTTSHNYTWQEFVLGDVGFSNALYDAWGTDENNVWACGGISINDSVHGLLHWDGTQWTPMGRGGGYAMFGFAADDIWTVGGSVFHYDGQNWNEVLDSDPVLLANIPYTSVWGTSSSNLYLGNQWGKIIHWDGSKASDLGKISEYGITGIAGINNIIYITASTVAGTSPCELFLFDGASFYSVIRGSGINPGTDELLGPFNDIWTYDGKELYIPGNTINIRRNNIWTRHTPNFFISRIQGNKSNNIFATGHFGGVTHYNGKTWFRYNNIFDTSTVLTGVKVFQNSVFIVGLNSSQAFIYKGTIQ